MLNIASFGIKFVKGMGLASVGIGFAYIYSLGHKAHQAREANITTVRTGAFSHAEYLKETAVIGGTHAAFNNNYNFSEPRYTKDVSTTVIHFEDGSTFIFGGLVDAPFAKGDHIAIKVNANDRRWIEAV